MYKTPEEIKALICHGGTDSLYYQILFKLYESMYGGTDE